MFCGLSLLCILAALRAPAQAPTKQSDLEHVLQLISAASDAYQMETNQCPAGQHPPCAAHDTASHQARIAAYQAARTALIAYINAWGGDPNWQNHSPSSVENLKAIVRLAFLSERGEMPAEAVKYYRLSLDSPLSGTTTTVVTGSPETVKDVALAELTENCHLAAQSCQVGVTGTVVLGPAWTLPGGTSDTASDHLAPNLVVTAPTMLDHLTVGQLDQLRQQLTAVGPQ
jgi:hypothetical protein